MERGRRYGDAADLHRLEHGVGVEGAGAPHVDANLFQLGDLHLGGELAGERPARLAAPDAPELRVQPQRVDLHHHPVGAVVERVQQLLESRDLAVGRAQVGDLFVVRLDREAPRPELLEQLVLRGDRELLARRLDVEAEDAEAPAAGDLGIQLAQRSGRGVAGVGEGRLAGALPLLVQFREARLGKVCLAAHFRSEEHTSELQSPYDIVCRHLLEKKKKKEIRYISEKKKKKKKK